jgi:hypothetical protein
MPVIQFALLDAAGTIARLVLLRTLADLFTGPLTDATRFIDRYQWWLVGLSVGIGLVQLSRRRTARRGSGSRPSRMLEGGPSPARGHRLNRNR